MAREGLKRLLFVPVIAGIVLTLILADRMAFCIDLFVQNYVAVEPAAEIRPKPGTPIEIRLPKTPADGENLLDLNYATQEELDALPGIGKIRADDIVKQREKMGGFYTTADIMCTQGVGKTTYEKIKDMVTVSARKPD